MSFTTRNLPCLLLTLTCFFLATTKIAGQKPLIDPKSTTPTQTVTSEELNKIPGSRDVRDLIKVMPSNPPPGYTSSVGQAPGMNLININGPSENVTFYLPNEIFRSQPFAGTMVTRSKPGGETTSNQFAALWKNGRFYWNEGGFEGEIISYKEGEFTLNITSQAKNFRYSFDVPVQSGSYLPGNSDFPTSGTSGNPLQIRYPINGALPSNIYFRIGGVAAPILTTTAGSLVIQNNYTIPGLTEIETNIGNGIQRYKFRNITLRLSADKTNLVKGETTPLRIEVAGLTDLRAPASMTIDASGVINMSGGNSQSFSIPAADIGTDGIYRLGRTLTGTSAGGFGVKVTVVVEKEN